MPFTPIFPTPFLTWLFFIGAIFALLAVSEWVAARTGPRPEDRCQLVSGIDWLVISIIEFLAATFDSILGATVQARYFIPATGKITEARPSEGLAAVVHSGWPWLDNNMVNLVCTGSVACLGLLWLAI